jgi:hypothetical protein
MIHNKSTHPVEVKKISIRLWTLRDEIEAAIERRMKECEAAGIPLFIEDIKKFYNLNLQAPLTEQENILQLHPQSESSDDGIASMMESLNEEEKPQDTPEGEAANKTFNEAEELIAEQTSQGLENKKPNPILERPYQRQPPDLEKISYGFTLLADINMDTVLSFTKDKFLHGQSVVMEFLIPQSFMMTASVVYCHYYALRSRIISSTKPDYRLQCRFNFSIPGERDTLRNFLKSVEPTIQQRIKAKKEVEEDDSLGI